MPHAGTAPEIKNETRYPTGEVTRIILRALDPWGWPNRQNWLVVTVSPHETGSHSGEGETTLAPGSAEDYRTHIWIGTPADYPNAQHPTYQGHTLRYVYRTWQEALFEIMAHESYHIYESDDELKAERYGLHRLSEWRRRRLLRRN